MTLNWFRKHNTHKYVKFVRFAARKILGTFCYWTFYKSLISKGFSYSSYIYFHQHFPLILVVEFCLRIIRTSTHSIMCIRVKYLRLKSHLILISIPLIKSFYSICTHSNNKECTKLLSKGHNNNKDYFKNRNYDW